MLLQWNREGSNNLSGHFQAKGGMIGEVRHQVGHLTLHLNISRETPRISINI